jgi:hypothetical protein
MAKSEAQKVAEAAVKAAGGRRTILGDRRIVTKGAFSGAKATKAAKDDKK